MRRLNSALLLELIRGKRSVSRAELARLSGLAKPTVSSQVADLVRRGLVVEHGAGEPEEGGGKPPKLLQFNALAGNLIGAEIGSPEVRVRLADMDGAVLDREDVCASPGRGADHILGVLEEAIKTILARVRGRKRKLMAIAIAAPGRVDVDSGVVLEAGNVFHWRNVAVRDRIERAFRVPTLVENDINLAAFGELQYGICQGVRNFVLIRLGAGVGAGLVLGGRVYQGNHWAAGEIGHMVFDGEAAAGTLDERGYLESAIGSDRLRERIRLAAPGLEAEGALSGASGLSGGLAEAVKRGDPSAAGILDDLATHLSLATANLVATLDPELIVLGGELVDLAADRIRQAVARIVPWPVRIELSTLGADGALLGALGSARGIVHQVLCGLDRGDFRPLRKR
jgi:glucokinase